MYLKTRIKRDDEVLRVVTPGLKITLSQIRDDYTVSAGGKYNNGLSGNVWDRRFNAVSAAIAPIKNLQEIPIDRHVWKTMGVFNEKDGTLYLFTSHKNFFIVQKKIQAGKFSHYMYPLTIF